MITTPSLWAEEMGAGPAEEWSAAEDAVAILNRFGVERAAVVGLSRGGGITLA